MDIEQAGVLEQYLLNKGYPLPANITSTEKLRGGVSNRAIIVRFQNGDAWVVKQALEKLRVQADWFSSPTRIHREALGLRWCAELTTSQNVPSLTFEDTTHHIIGMQAIPNPHDNWKALLLDGQVNLAHVEAFGRLLATFHTHADERQDELASIFADYTFFESLRLEPYYQFTASNIAEASTFLEELIADTRLHRVTLTHGDYSPKNILIYQDKLVLLDYEVIHWGDPAFDLGFSMTHLLSKAHYVTQQRQQFANASHVYWQSYWQALGDVAWRPDLEQRATRHTLACLLARVAGRSPLEYFSPTYRQTQRNIVVQAMQATLPSTMPALIDEFITKLDHYDKH